MSRASTAKRRYSRPGSVEAAVLVAVVAGILLGALLPTLPVSWTLILFVVSAFLVTAIISRAHKAYTVRSVNKARDLISRAHRTHFKQNQENRRLRKSAILQGADAKIGD